MPYTVLFINTPNDEINFNVHPGKREVQFKDNGGIYKLVYRVLCDALSTNDTIDRSNELVFVETPANIDSHETDDLHINMNANTSKNEMQAKLRQTFTNQSLLDNLQSKTGEYRLGYPIGQLNNIFILAQNKKGLLIIDTHAAHERILFEELKKNKNRHCQRLSVPEYIEFEGLNPDLISNRIDIINQYGFDAKMLNNGTFIIQGVPEILVGKQYRVVLQEIAEGISDHGIMSNVNETVDQVLGNIACKSAIKVNQKLSLSEMEYILRKAETTLNGGICNHGRPTWIELPIGTLDRLFSRGK